MAGQAYMTTEGVGAAGDDPFIIFPSDTKAEMDTVNAAMKNLNWDIQNSKKIGPRFKKAWTAHLANWQAFLVDKEGFFTRGTSGTWNKVKEYKTLANRWRAKFSEQGGTPSGLALYNKPPMSALEKAALTAGVIGGAVLVWRLVK